MTLRSPGIQIPISDDGTHMLRESMRLSLYLPPMHRQVASEIVRSLERYAEAIVPKLDTWYDDWGEPQDLDTAAWERIKQATLGESAYIQVIGSYERVAFKYRGATITSPEFPNSISSMHCWFPTEYLVERGPAHLRALAVDILGSLPIHSGNLALDLHPLVSDVGLSPTFGEIALRHPGFSIDVADYFELGTRVHDVTWLTFLGQPALGEVGGVAALRSRLRSADTTVEELPGDRAVITLGEWPDAGDVVEGRTLPNYRELARVLEPVLYRERRENWSRVYPEQLRQVERRFLD